VLRDGTDLGPADLARFVNDTAPYYLVPRYIEICEQLPMTPTGRVQKFKLRERGVTDATWDREASTFVLDRG
jgi:crotonobetaine/carnitine-CoA ligase